ncbi:MAG: NAD-binding protein [Leptospiraceae bacterium]|nr:NAD-binding protein [Leptospiraceae bacterium]
MYYLSYGKLFILPISILLVLLTVGTAGYHFLEGWNLLDSVYMTLITLTTVGFGETHPLSPQGQVFTIFLLMGGVLMYAFAINDFVHHLLNHNFREYTQKMKMQKYISNMKDHFIIVGGGRMACVIGRQLETFGEPFVFIEQSESATLFQERPDWPHILKDALLDETLEEAGIERARGLACCLPTDADNLFVVLSARRMKPDLQIQTRVQYESSRLKMLQAGADHVISPNTLGGLQVARSFVHPDIESFLSVFRDTGMYEFDMKVERIEEDSHRLGLPLKEAKYREEKYLVIGIKKAGGRMVFAPPATYILKHGDEVFLLGAESAREENV